MKPLNIHALELLPAHSWTGEEIERHWKSAVSTIRRLFSKVLVLDDDPTGSQTVYGLPVFTDFSLDDILAARRDPSHVVYVLTNSRSLKPEESEAIHRKIMRNWIAAAKTATAHQSSVAAAGETLVISRSDSTLRGHFPLETKVIREELTGTESAGGEILIPVFAEGGRFTFNDIHYVREGDTLTPAGETEFAQDSSFGYNSSNLRNYVEEKTGGSTRADEVISISLEALRGGNIASLVQILVDTPNDGRVIVNAVSYDDLKVFLVALAQAFERGARFVFRSAASLVKVLAGLDDRPLLEAADLFSSVSSPRLARTDNRIGAAQTSSVNPGVGPGILVAGSYVNKTTQQLVTLVNDGILAEVKLNIREALYAEQFPAELERARGRVDACLNEGRSVALYTTNAGSREYLRADEGTEGLSNLELSARISAGLVNIVSQLSHAPRWIITKGGITSHDIAVKSLAIRRAMVLGQIIPGVPVWRCGKESRWPGIPLIIFPGNVGDNAALAQVVQKLV